MANKKTKTKFVPLHEDDKMKTYRVTFECYSNEYIEVIDYMMGYGQIFKEEVEVKVKC